MDLLERAEPLADLDELLAASAAGGHVAVLSGEAGAGKSSLAAAFVERAGARARVLWGSCDPLLTPRALGPLHDIARQVGGALRESMARGPPRGGLREAAGRARRAAPARPAGRGHRGSALGGRGHAGHGGLPRPPAARRSARCCCSPTATTRSARIIRCGPCWPVCRGRRSGGCSLAPLSAEAVAELARRAGRRRRFGVRGDRRQSAAGHRGAGRRRRRTSRPTVRDLVLSRLAGLSPAAREVAGLVSVVPVAGRAGAAARPGRGGRRVPRRRGAGRGPATAWRSGTSCCGARWRSRCPRYAGPPCTPRCSPRWRPRPGGPGPAGAPRPPRRRRGGRAALGAGGRAAGRRAGRVPAGRGALRRPRCRSPRVGRPGAGPSCWRRTRVAAYHGGLTAGGAGRAAGGPGPARDATATPCGSARTCAGCPG